MLGLATAVALAAPRAREGEARRAARQAIPAQCTD